MSLFSREETFSSLKGNKPLIQQLRKKSSKTKTESILPQ